MSAASCLMRTAGRAVRASTLASPLTCTSRALSCLTPRLPLLPSLVSRGQLTCSVPSRGMGAFKGDEEVVTFLKEEIATEKQNTRVPPKLTGWTVKTEGSEVTLTKTVQGEKVMITLNVNHTVDSAVPDDGTEEAPEMLSKPTFEVDLIKTNGKTVSFTCSYTRDEEQPEGGQEEEADIFAIDEVTMFEGDNHSDSTYAVAGDLLDGYLYDLFMSMLAERGVDNAFVEELSEWCSVHEHAQYVGLLSELDKWCKI
jgi:complement component 1 Q subcomponent-binding protein